MIASWLFKRVCFVERRCKELCTGHNIITNWQWLQAASLQSTRNRIICVVNRVATCSSFLIPVRIYFVTLNRLFLKKSWRRRRCMFARHILLRMGKQTRINIQYSYFSVKIISIYCIIKASHAKPPPMLFKLENSIRYHLRGYFANRL